MEIEEGSYSETSFLDSYFPRWQCDSSPAAFAIVDVRTKVDVRWNCRRWEEVFISVRG